MVSQIVSSLEFQAEQAFMALDRAFDSRSFEDASYAVSLYQAFYETMKAAIEPGRLADFSRFNVQYVIGRTASDVLRDKHGQISDENLPSIFGVESLVDDIKSGAGNYQLQLKTKILVDKGGFDAVRQGISYARSI